MYVNLPKRCGFADEIRTVFKYYLENNVKPSAHFKKSSKYNVHDYNAIVGTSCLVYELVDRFVTRIKYKTTVKKINQPNGDDQAWQP
jgi:hypothetical protein